MNTKLDSITTQYRKFNVNQALTEGQLNEFIDYFEDQDRLSRTQLIGTGLLCGFESSTTRVTGGVKKSSDNKLKKDSGVISDKDSGVTPAEEIEFFNAITITQGAGITTDGDLITLREKGENENEVSIDLPGKNYTYYRPYTDTLNYPHFFKNNAQIPLLELLTDEDYEESRANGGPVLPTVDQIPQLDKKTIILYLESYSNEESPCQDADCDNQGAEQVSNLRVLLADMKLAEAYIVNGNAKDSIYKIQNSYEVLYDELPDIEVQRVILDKNVTTPALLKQKFRNAMQTGSTVADLSEGFTAIAATFGISLNLGNQTLNAKLTSLLNTTPSNLDDYQYRYDLLKNLVDTYNEIRELLLHLKSVCCPDIASFPKHLMLGPVGAPLNLGDYTPYRHDFYHSPINTNDDENYENLIMLGNRFVRKLNGFQTFTGPVKITPSNEAVRLGRKSVPIYFNVDQSLLEKWNYNYTKNNKETYNLSYHTENLADADFIQNPLNYNLDNFDFYTIEGHLGLPVDVALRNIKNIIEEKNLGIDVIKVVLDKGITSGSTGGTKKLASGQNAEAAAPTVISIQQLRDQLSSISSGISNQSTASQDTLQSISSLDSQLKLLNNVTYAQTQDSGVSVLKQNPKDDEPTSELLSDFLERISGLEHLAGTPDGGTFVIVHYNDADNKVLADFSLPFVCCSKKEPVFLVLPAAKLCKGDAAIPITILPLDGEVKAFVNNTQINAITKIASGQNLFDPNLVPAQYFGQQIAFTVNGDPVETQMVVYDQPNATIAVSEPAYGEDPELQIATVVFTVGSPAGLNYSISFGDGKSASGQVPPDGKITHDYQLVEGREDNYNPVITLSNGNNCSKQYNLPAIKVIGQTTVKCLNGMEIIVQYNQSKGKCPGGHNCNVAEFDLMANTVNLGRVNLNNTGALEAHQQYPVGETSGPNRVCSFTITPTQAQDIANTNTSGDGFISFSLVCALSYCHTGVAWTTLKLGGTVLYDGCPVNNFLTINPCTGEIRH